MKFLLQAILVSLCLSLIACAPRGESRSLEQVVNTAKARFMQVKNVTVPETVKTQLPPIEASLDVLTNSPEGKVKVAAKKVAEGLGELVDHASYTNRPAMGALMSQYLAMSEKKEKEINTAAAKLLAARTYSLLASELETAKFAL